MKKAVTIISMVFLLILVVHSCNRDDDEAYSATLSLEFEHLLDGDPVEFDQLIYINEAGNPYEVTNIQWFISEVNLVDEKDFIVPVSAVSWIHYVDTDLPSSLTWVIPEGVNPGNYKGLQFVFGIKGEKNKPMMFTDPPESNMIWPYHMGGDEGGYHYMKLNGFWETPEKLRTPFNFHIGVGQEYDQDGNVVGFFQNWFEANLTGPEISIPAGGHMALKIKMNIENWFQDPYTYDHNVFGGSIMNNQEAMGHIKENGHNVFTLAID